MRRFTLVAGTESTARVLRGQLESYLEGRAALVARWIDGTEPALLRAAIEDPGEFLLLSSWIVREELEAAGLLTPSEGPPRTAAAEAVSPNASAAPRAAPAAPVVVARRSVDADGLDRIVALPPGTPLLFVNDRPETARDCIESLADIGLDALRWRPWWPGAEPPPPEYRIAAVAGESDLVPPGMEEIVDIGVRVLEFGTLAEIFGRLGLPAEEIGRFSRRYLAKIASLARRLARATEEARRLSGHLGSVIDNLRHGILVYDAEGRISVCNEEVRALLKLRPGDYAGAALSGVVRQRELLEFLERRRGEETAVFKLPEGSVVAARFELGGGHTVATLRDEGEASAEAYRLARELRRRGHVAKYGMDDLVGGSEEIRRAKRIAGRLAATDLSILIHGESGTGKELFASAIHAASARAAGPFLAVDLGALSDDLIESELFGYEEGAFTGAKKGGKAGLFEQADGGTLFLDEIGNVSTKVQKRLLRALQEKEIMRVGGSEIKRVDVRVIAATNEDLLERAARGEFREDLYFRLKMGFLRIPPLRERPEDIPLLVARFLELEGARELRVDPVVLEALAARDWPGNVRELRNALTYMLAVREGEEIGPGDLPDEGYFSSACGERGSSAPHVAERAGAPTGGGYEGGGYQGGSPAGGGPVTPAAAYGFLGAALFAAGLDSGGGRSAAGLSPDDRFVLLAVAELEARGRHAGREAVAEICASRGLELGPGAVRARFDRLAGLGYLVSSRGRGGTRLTEAGRQLLASSLA